MVIAEMVQSVSFYKLCGPTERQIPTSYFKTFFVKCIKIDVYKTLSPPFKTYSNRLNLSPWPTDLTIDRDHPLIKDYLLTIFEAFGTKQNRTTEGCSKLKSSVNMTSSGKKGLDIRTKSSSKNRTGSGALKFSVVQGVGDRPSDRHVQSNMPLLFQRKE